MVSPTAALPSKHAQKVIQARVAALMASDSTNVEKRQEFNRWLFAKET